MIENENKNNSIKTYLTGKIIENKKIKRKTRNEKYHSQNKNT